MSQPGMRDRAIALFSSDGHTWHDGSAIVWRRDAAVTKIVIGTLEDDHEGADEAEDAEKGAAIGLPENLAALFPNLTHVHLWGQRDGEELPTLPPSLRCLDVRNSPRLRVLPDLPASLDTLILQRCARLIAPSRTDFPALRDLSIAGCEGLKEAWLHAVLRTAPRLEWLDASACPQLTRIPIWAASLVDIRLDKCLNLKALPPQWPPNLRRLGLRHATAVAKLPNFHARLDFIDLAGTHALRALPDERAHPRTLFLHGSGLLVPPASEHGANPDENVAATTAAYFDDVALTGVGDVKRCKLLVLGNGGAGKTCLSLALTGRNPAEAAQLGSTHGVKFWDWADFDANVDGSMERVHLHVWDFGGQEIYHNTHRLFMSTGAVFVVVWHPEQDGRQPPRNDGDYADEWRPLRYWLDFIQLSCSHRARVAIVCSHETAPTVDLQRRLGEQIPAESRDDYQCFYLDSLNGVGEQDRLVKWLQDTVGEVVHTQGRAVPTYWEIAQDMVEAWTAQAQAATETPPIQHLEQAAFEAHLDREIQSAIKADPDWRLAKLAKSHRSRTFRLDDDRVRRTLGFLTHSGWLYWDPHLFQGRVIVGQQWALDGLYQILERKPRSSVFRALIDQDGRFTLSDLGRWVWNTKGFSHEEQELLRSYMEQCGLCFRLRSAEDSWREEPVYVSFEHLPTARSARLRQEFDRRASGTELRETTLSSKRLHKLHWQRFIVSAGASFGKNADYAEDGLLVRNTAGQDILVLYNPERGGLGGTISLAVQGPDSAERLQALAEHVKTFMPDHTHKPSDASHGVGAALERQEVFISYAWNDAGDTSQDYEEPVEAIAGLFSHQGLVPAASHGREEGSGRTLVRDRDFMKRFDSISKFTDYGSRCPLVIVVHSDKYWRSANCMEELVHIDRDLREQQGKSRKLSVVPVEHPSSRIRTAKGRDDYLGHWRNAVDIPSRLEDPDGLKERAMAAIREWSRDLSADLDYNIQWRKDRKQGVLDEVLARVGTAASTTPHD